MNEEQIKQRIVLHFKALIHKKESIQLKGFTFLINQFFEEPNEIEIDELDFLDYYGITLSMILSFTKGLKEEQDYTNLAIIRDIKAKIDAQVAENIEDDDELFEFNLTNEFYSKQLHNILNNK